MEAKEPKGESTSRNDKTPATDGASEGFVSVSNVSVSQQTPQMLSAIQRIVPHAAFQETTSA